MAFHHSPRIVSDGVVFAIDAANPRSYPGSGLVLTDIIGDANATITNGTIVSGPGGNIINLDGSGDYVSATLPSGFTKFTISLWYKFNVLPSTYTYLAQLGPLSGGAGKCLAIAIWQNSGGDARKIYFHFGGSYEVQDYTVADTNWHNIVATVNVNSYKLYVDGELKDTASYTTSMTGTAGAFHLGQYIDGTTYYPNAQYSSVNVFNRALSANEVLQNYNGLKERFL